MYTVRLSFGVERLTFIRSSRFVHWSAYKHQPCTGGLPQAPLIAALFISSVSKGDASARLVSIAALGVPQASLA
eukprot:2996869-Pyramimonas_sp.AAC.1